MINGLDGDDMEIGGDCGVEIGCGTGDCR